MFSRAVPDVELLEFMRSKAAAAASQNDFRPDQCLVPCDEASVGSAALGVGAMSYRPSMNSTQPLDTEIDTALGTIDEMVEGYLGLTERRKVGEIHNTLYDDLLDYANFRVETITSITLLAKNGRVADALALSRSVLEHLLLFRLQCRGSRYLTPGPEFATASDYKKGLADAKALLADLHARGEAAHCVGVKRYPRGRNQYMWIYKGLTNDEDPDFFVSRHYFLFENFRPETMRLDDRNYLSYIPKNYPEPKALRAAKERHKQTANFEYKHYLSWSALLTSLSINDLVTQAEIHRIEAHYTFLGKFLHPTHGAARDLHEQANFHNGRAAIGMASDYTRISVLLAVLYAMWLMRGVLEEISDLFESAPAKYIAEPGTGPMRILIDYIPERFGYFWFISNRAPLWDRFNYAVHDATDEQLADGGYPNLPDDDILFEQNIYEHMKSTLSGWSNVRVGVYRSPLIP